MSDGFDEVTPHRSRKNTRRWCKGKTGVEHVLEIRLSKIGDYRTTKDPEHRCGWRLRQRYRRGLDGRYTPHSSWWSFACDHERGCSVCGKIIDLWLKDKTECPDYTPREAE